MLKNKRFFERIGLVVKAKKKWAPLPRVDIAIFDTLTGAYLARMLHDHVFFSIDFRGESYHIPSLIVAYGQYLLCRGKVSISCLYFSRLIRKLGAKVCITNQDSHCIFYELDKQMPEVSFIAIQQGLKCDVTMHVFSEISGDYFSYGKAYADKLANGKANIYVCGSVKANMTQISEKKHSRVCFISGSAGHDPGAVVFRNVNFAEFFYPTVYLTIREVDRFCMARGIEFIITPKSNRDHNDRDRNSAFNKEWDFYKKILGRDPPLVMGDSYRIAGESEVVISNNSALAYELLGRDCKVVFLNLTAYFNREKSFNFGWPLELPDQGQFWTNLCDTNYIQNMIDRIWNMPTDEWKKVTAPYQEQLMHYDPNNSILLNHINSILNASA